MDIGSLSIMMSQSKIQNAVGVSILKMVMDTSKESAVAMNNMINESTKDIQKLAEPHLGKSIDVRI